MARLSLASDREFSLNDSNLLSGWISYLRTDYRDSLINESHHSLQRRHTASAGTRSKSMHD
ncbi:hypothetical protein GNF10_25425 [Nostoc sp. UCD121]|uniref:hypothetical protein n=1 Tax=Nostoc sp. UCD121 TaxID=2681305 RepID=UPI001624CA90|nr:hypothetical protein [Nostoc sp. UCD121]MBC1279211.1 hypothetical protein [Nostoc sp. UCD121]